MPRSAAGLLASCALAIVVAAGVVHARPVPAQPPPSTPPAQPQPPPSPQPAPAPTQPPGSAAPTAPPAQPGTPAAAPAPDAGQLVFASDAGVVINAIKQEKTADFELVMAKLREALAKSPDPVRQKQAATWRVLKAEETGAGGLVFYLFVMDPVVKGADYTMSRILAEAFPAEIGDLWPKLRDAYAGPLFRLTLQDLARLQAPAPAATPPPKS